jgi:hypothetical protein
MFQLAQVFLGIKRKIFFLASCAMAGKFLSSKFASRAIPVIRLGWAVIIYHILFELSHAGNGYRAKFRRTEADAKLRFGACRAPKSAFRVARIRRCTAMFFRNFWIFVQLNQDTTPLTTDPSDQFSHSVHDALRNCIPSSIKASPDFHSNVLLSSVSPLTRQHILTSL